MSTIACEDVMIWKPGKVQKQKIEDAVLSGYITTLKNRQKLDVSSEGPSSRVSIKVVI
jgi:hypothetical protein